jgi:hypothetical protein
VFINEGEVLGERVHLLLVFEMQVMSFIIRNEVLVWKNSFQLRAINSFASREITYDRMQDIQFAVSSHHLPLVITVRD